jgi:hypothetical protein
MESLTLRYLGNNYVSGSCTGKQEIEGFDKVYSTQSAKDRLKEKQEKKYEIRGTVQKRSNLS